MFLKLTEYDYGKHVLVWMPNVQYIQPAWDEHGSYLSLVGKVDSYRVAESLEEIEAMLRQVDCMAPLPTPPPEIRYGFAEVISSGVRPGMVIDED